MLASIPEPTGMLFAETHCSISAVDISSDIFTPLAPVAYVCVVSVPTPSVNVPILLRSAFIWRRGKVPRICYRSFHGMRLPEETTVNTLHYSV